MKRFILFLFTCTFLAGGANAQSGVLKRTYLAYTNGAPVYTPTTSTGMEAAVDILTGNFYTWNRIDRLWTGVQINRRDVKRGQVPVYNGSGMFTAATATNYEDYTVIADSIGNDTLLVTDIDVLFAPGANQSTHTIALPASPNDRQIFTITFVNAVTALTLGGNGKTIVGATTTAAAGSRIRYKYYSTPTARYVKIQ